MRARSGAIELRTRRALELLRQQFGRNVSVLNSELASMGVAAMRAAESSLPALAVGNNNIDLVWQGPTGVNNPMPNDTYMVFCHVEGQSALLGRITTTVLEGATKTAAGCRVVVSVSGLLAISAGAGRLQALAFAPKSGPTAGSA